MVSYYKRLAIIATLFLLFAVAPALASVPAVPAVPRDYVEDLAGIVNNNARVRLDGYLQELERKTTAQFVVLTVTSLQGEPIDEFSINVAHNKWKLGQKGKDNGVLLVVALKDRKYRFEIGYGLEGVLPDSFVGTVGRQYLVPYFRKGDYSKGIFAAVVAVSNRIAASQGVKITGMPQVSNTYARRAGKGGGIAGTILSLLFFAGAVILFIKNPRLFLLLLFASSMGGNRNGWGGGGFGGGGFGGGGSFGGGGGGGFGGGGASGGW